MSEQGHSEEGVDNILEEERPSELFEGELPEGLIILQRHTKYDSTTPEGIKNVANDPENRNKVRPGEEKFGSITEEGAEETRNITRQRLEEIFKNEDLKQVGFLFAGSSTHYLGVEGLGQRALQTAEIEMDETRKFLEEKGLDPEEHILNLQKGPKEIRKTEESAMYGAAPGLVFGELGAGKDFNAFLEQFVKGKFDERLQEAGAETSEELAKRVERHLQILARFARMYHKDYPDKKLVVFTNSHNDAIESFAQKGVEGLKDGFKVANNDAIAISLSEGSTSPTTLIGGEQYDVPSVDPESRFAS